MTTHGPTVLVPEAHTLGAIGVIRSLGRAGYKVIAMSSDLHALGFHSNFAAEKIIAPSYGSELFACWLREIVNSNFVQLIIPSEAFLLAIENEFDDFKYLLPVPQSRADTYRAFSKIAVTDTLSGNGEWRDMLPPGMTIHQGDALPKIEEIEALGAPFYVKSDGCLNQISDDAFLARCETASDALETLRKALASFDAVLIQGFVPGMKAAISFCINADGTVLSETGVLGLRTTPHTGGMMSLRESWVHARMAKVARAWLQELNWTGVAMIECKWDPETDQFWLIEVNARYWGYLHLDLFAGADVPLIQADAFFGITRMPKQPYRLGVLCRHTFPGDTGWLISVLKDCDVPILEKIKSCIRFIADFADPRTHSDLIFPGDKKLYWIEAKRYAGTLLTGLKRRLLRKTSQHHAAGEITEQ
jgi:hypothetical protein